MYKDSELIKCPKCDGLGLYAPDYYGNLVFHHKTNSLANEGYFTFVINCQN